MEGNNIELNLIGDSAELLKNMRAARNELVEMQEAMAGFREEQSRATQDVAKSAMTMQKTNAESAKASKDMETATKAAVDGVKAMSAAQSETAKQTKDVADELKNNTKEADKLKEKLDEVNKSAEDMMRAIVQAISSSDFEGLTKTIEDFKASLSPEDAKLFSDSIQGEIDALVSMMKEGTTEIESAHQEQARVTSELTGESLERIQKFYEDLMATDNKVMTMLDFLKKEMMSGDYATFEDAIAGAQKNVVKFIDTLEPQQAEEFSAALDHAAARLEELEVIINGTGKALSNPTKELKELKKLIMSGELEGELLSKATKRAAELTDQINKTNKEIKILSSGTFKMDALLSGIETVAGGFSLVQGSMALVGKEGEDLQKTLVKLQAIQAVVTGVQSLQNKILGESAIKTATLTGIEKLRALAIDQTTGKLNKMNIAMMATVGGAAIAGIVMLVANWDRLKDSISGATAETEANASIAREAAKQYSEEIAMMRQKVGAIDRMKEGYADYNHAVSELIAQNPILKGQIDEEADSWETIKNKVGEAESAYKSIAIIKASQDLITKELAKQLEDEANMLDKGLGTFDKIKVSLSTFINGTASAYSYSARLVRESVEEELDASNKRIAVYQNRIEEEQKLLEGNTIYQLSEERTKNIELLKEHIAAKERTLAVQRAAGDDTVALQRNIFRERIQLAREEGGDVAKAENDLRVFEASLRKKASDEALKQQKAVHDAQLKAQLAFNDAMEQLIEDLWELEDSDLAGEDKIAAQLAVNMASLEAQEDNLKELLAQSGAIGEERAQKEAEIEEYIGLMRAHAIEKANEEILKLRVDEAVKAARQNEQLALLSAEAEINAKRDSFKTEEEFETFKQTQLLLIKKKFALQALNMLSGDLTDEQKLRKAQLENEISDMDLQLKKLGAKSKNNGLTSAIDSSLAKVFGLDDSQVGAFKSAANQIIGIYGDMLNEMFAQQLEASDKLIEKLDNDYEAQLQAVEREKELQEMGKANSVQMEEDKLNAIKKQQLDAQKEREKILKKQAVLEGIQQSMSLASAAASLYQSLAALPLGVGLIMGGIAVAGLFAAFRSVKAQANAVSQPNIKLRHGGSGDEYGIITGKSHERGGEKFTDHIEVESGEAWGVLSRSASLKHGKEFHRVVDMMNKNIFPDVSNMSKPSTMLERIQDDPEVIQLHQYVRERNVNTRTDDLIEEMEHNTSEIKRMNDDITGLMKKLDDNRPNTWEDDRFVYVKKGSKVVKYPKRSA